MVDRATFETDYRTHGYEVTAQIMVPDEEPPLGEVFLQIHSLKQ
jgi:hypothetical protein